MQLSSTASTSPGQLRPRGGAVFVGDDQCARSTRRLQLLSVKLVRSDMSYVCAGTKNERLVREEGRTGGRKDKTTSEDPRAAKEQRHGKRGT